MLLYCFFGKTSLPKKSELKKLVNTLNFIKTNSSKLVSWEEVHGKYLSDPDFAKILPSHAFEDFAKDRDMSALLDLIRQVVKTQGGLTLLARKTQISRQCDFI